MVNKKYEIHSQNKTEVYPSRISSPTIRIFRKFKRKTLRILTKPITEHFVLKQNVSPKNPRVFHPVIHLLIYGTDEN